MFGGLFEAQCPCSEAQGLQGSLSLLLEAVLGLTPGRFPFEGGMEQQITAVSERAAPNPNWFG